MLNWLKTHIRKQAFRVQTLRAIRLIDHLREVDPEILCGLKRELEEFDRGRKRWGRRTVKSKPILDEWDAKEEEGEKE